MTVPSPSIALAMIVKNEAANIQRCLDSAQPWVDHMVVVDTGSSDDTAAIARRCGAEVRYFEWCNDFSAARNAALDAVANYDWVLVLDADEWIVSGGERLRQFARHGPCLGNITIQSDFRQSNGEIQVGVSQIARLLPRGVRYTGRIHEFPAVENLPFTDSGLVVRHSGYLDVDKTQRNLPLLEAELCDQPNDPCLHYLIGRELQVAGELEKACIHFKHACHDLPRRYTWERELVVCYLDACKRTHRFEEALALAEVEQVHCADFPDFYFTLADVLLEMFSVNPPSDVAEFEIVENCWLKCLELGETNAAVKGRGSYLAAYNLGVFSEVWRDRQCANRWYRQAADAGYLPAMERLA